MAMNDIDIRPINLEESAPDAVVESNSYMWLEELNRFNAKYAIPIIAMVGMVGNLMALVVFLFSPLRRMTISVFVAALSFTDFIFLLFLIMGWVERFKANIFLLSGMCHIMVFTTYTVSFLSLWFIVAFTAEIFLSLHCPRLHKTINKPRRAVAICLGLVVVAGAIYSFSFGMIRVVKDPGSRVPCQFKGSNKTAMYISILDSVLSLFVPFILLIYMYSHIIFTVASISKRRNGGMDSSQSPFLAAKVSRHRAPKPGHIFSKMQRMALKGSKNFPAIISFNQSSKAKKPTEPMYDVSPINRRTLKTTAQDVGSGGVHYQHDSGNSHRHKERCHSISAHNHKDKVEIKSLSEKGYVKRHSVEGNVQSQIEKGRGKSYKDNRIDQSLKEKAHVPLGSYSNPNPNNHKRNSNGHNQAQTGSAEPAGKCLCREMSRAGGNDAIKGTNVERNKKSQHDPTTSPTEETRTGQQKSSDDHPSTNAPKPHYIQMKQEFSFQDQKNENRKCSGTHNQKERDCRKYSRPSVDAAANNSGVNVRSRSVTLSLEVDIHVLQSSSSRDSLRGSQTRAPRVSNSSPKRIRKRIGSLSPNMALDEIETAEQVNGCRDASKPPKCLRGSAKKSFHPLIKLQHKCIRMMVTIAAMFLLLNLPSHVIRIQSLIRSFFDTSYQPTELEYQLQQLFQTISYLNFVLNVVVYSACAKSFRTAFKLLPWHVASTFRQLANRICRRQKPRESVWAQQRQMRDRDEHSRLVEICIADLRISEIPSLAPGFKFVSPPCLLLLESSAANKEETATPLEFGENSRKCSLSVRI